MSRRPRDEPSTRPLLDKLGLRPGMRVAVLGDFAAEFRAQLLGRAADVSADPEGCDLIFLAAEDRTQLAKLPGLVARLRRDAALWVVRPRGSPLVTEREVREAGLAAGVVDVKVVHFSETHSAAKFVFRRSDR
jgi:hypothetical protein